ncbi:MAG TPA: hypothetical protein VER03_24075 [Bryobacteraceae bacterium]|nr:hypothetical protein [Bryobacteraceae bacterium]
MRRLILLFTPLCLLAQDAPKSAASAEESIVVEPPFHSSVEIGYRWLGQMHGSFNTYRSVVNLGEGPRLLNFDFSMAPSHKWIDSFEVRAANWGGDPYNTATLRAVKQGAYRLNVDYRNIQYFNALPTFANPFLETGVLQSQRTFDTVRRYSDVELELLPNRRFQPFVGYTHTSGSGLGVTPYVLSFNEYPVSTDLRDRTDTVRGGVRIETSRAHVTLEQGGYNFSDDQRVFTTDRNVGNRTTPFSGQTLVLNNVEQLYDITGKAMYSKVHATANPTSWFDLYGQFLFVQPKIETNLNESAQGLFAQNPPLQFFPSRTFLFAATAKQPHTRAGAGFELRPFRRLRILDSWVTDRLHTASSLDRLDYNYSHHQIEALVEVTDRLTLRGGHRIVWGDSRTRTPELAAVPGLESSELKRQTALMGVAYRAAQKLTFNVDAEIASGDSAYFRTSLLNYQRVRIRSRYQVRPSLTLSYAGSLLNNDNPDARRNAPGLDDYDAVSIDNSLTLVFAPDNGKRIRVIGEYGRLSWRSDILYLVPQTLTPERSLYRENGHSGTLLVDAGLPFRGTKWSPRFSAGGSLYKSSGSRPTHYYQPMARVSAPIARHMDWNAEWRWWAMNEPFYRFENFRNHQMTFSVRIYQ